MKRLLLLLNVCLLVSISNQLNAQKLKGQALTDSLIKELPTLKDDTTKAKILNAIAWSSIDIASDKARIYAERALALSERLGWKYGICVANNTIGVIYKNEADYDQALTYLKKSFNVGQEIGNKSRMAMALNNIANVLDIRGEFPKALDASLEALKLASQVADSGLMGNVANTIGAIYYDAEIDLDKAVEYWQMALDIYERLEIEYGQIDALINIGLVYTEKEDAPHSLEYYRRGLRLANQYQNKRAEIIALTNIGGVYIRSKEYTKALDTLQLAVQLSTKSGDSTSLGYTLVKTGYLYSEMGDYSKAITYYSRGIKIFENINQLDDLVTAYHALFFANRQAGNDKAAIKALEQYIVYKDSVFNRENTAELARLEVKGEYEKKQIADSIHNAEAQKLTAVKLQRQRTMAFSGIGMAVLLLAFSIFVFRNNKKLAIEKNKSETLLYNILPEEIASELKDRGATTAQQFDNVTVLFTDFVNFTTAGERMGSQALVEELHSCFKVFDDIMERHGIEKIKTIGDAYLAVCGLPTANERHAEKTVQAAQEIKTFMLQRREQLGDKTFEIRIGVHSGEVVAGIVGVKKFAYDIWGDTVNTAARMEQNSEAGKINISQTTYKLVQDKFTCIYRGELEAKNKGMLKMYFVEG